MSSPYTPYKDDVPSSGSRPDSRSDLEDYFEKPLPAPYRLSGFYPSPSHSPSASSETLHMQQYGTVGSRGSYLSPLGAAAAVDTAGAGVRNSTISNLSMTGLGLPPPNRNSTWLEKEVTSQRKQRKLFIISCVALVGIIITAIILGTLFGTHTIKVGGADLARNNDTGNSTAGVVHQDDPNDPSKFTKDPKLHNSFYGVAYTMMDALYPDCNQKLPAVIEDMQLLSQLTNRIRLYGSDCNQTALVLEAIKQTKIDMKIFAGIFVVDGDDSAYTRQKDALKSALETYGADKIEGITVGNEFILNYVSNRNGTGADSAIGRQAAAILKENIDDTRTMLTDLGLSIPVGSSDAGSFFNDDLLESIDFGLSNIHAWFAPTTAADATTWTNEFYQNNNVQPASLLPNRPRMYIAETGWPTHSSDAEHENNRAGPGGEASEPNLQVFLDDFVCQANQAQTPYFFFEFSDVPWKDRVHGGVEGFWGLFDSNKKLKQVTIPDCSHD